MTRERLDVMEQVITCEACDLVTGCTGPVFMTGPTPARIVVLGEAPGKQEDEQGAPFVGPAGQLMRRTLTDAGFDVDADIVFVNTVSCLPNRSPTAPTPEWEHVIACTPNKNDQIELADPRLVLTVGKVALKSCRRELDMKVRGRPFLHNGRVTFATYHPSAALRNGNYEEAMLADVAAFRELYDAYVVRGEEWTKFIPDQCAGCSSIDVIWFEAAGLGWCEIHLPDQERPLWEERSALIAADLDRARGGTPDLGKVYVGENSPATSSAAADQAAVKAGTQAWKVLECIAADPCTNEEGQARTGIGGDSWRPRHKTLEEFRLIRPTGAERATSAGGTAEVWEVTESGRAQLAKRDPVPAAR